MCFFFLAAALFSISVVIRRKNPRREFLGLDDSSRASDSAEKLAHKHGALDLKMRGDIVEDAREGADPYEIVVRDRDVMFSVLCVVTRM